MLSRLIWLFLFIIWGFAAVVLSVQVWLAYTSKNWATTPGVVVAFYETPEYRYSVGDHTYTNSYGSCNELFNRLWAVRNSSKYAARYPLDAKVAVRYCPQRPGLAVLETDFDRSGIIIAGALVLVTSLCLAGLVFGWRFGRGGLPI
jgi:hypothetical protein